jgi:tetratricopeptide (TPR) repeat protein
LAELLLTNASELQWSRPEQCDRMLREALSLAERLADEHPDGRSDRRQLILCRTRLAWLLEDFRRFEEAEAFGGQAVALAEQMQAEFPEDADLKAVFAYAARIKGVALMANARLADAERMFARARDTLEELAAGGVPYYDWDLAMTHRELAHLLAKDPDRLDEAERSYRREVALVEKSVAADRQRWRLREQLAQTHRFWAFAMRDLGRPQEAEAAFREAIRLLERYQADYPGQAPFHKPLREETCKNLADLLATARERTSPGK